MATFAFEKLEVWKLSVNFVISLYKITDSFPKDERFGLTSQIRRATVSISSNIAEGVQEIHQKINVDFIT